MVVGGAGGFGSAVVKWMVQNGTYNYCVCYKLLTDRGIFFLNNYF